MLTAGPAAAASPSPSTYRCSPLVSGDVDATLAAYLAELHDQGRAPGKRLDGGGRGVLPDRHAREPSPAGERLARVLAGYRRTGGDRVLVHLPPDSAAVAAAASLTRSPASAAGSTP